MNKRPSPVCTVVALGILAGLFSLASCENRERKESIAPKETESFTFARKPDGPITFLSTQLNPVEEASKMRNAILKDFPGTVDFKPNDNNYIFSLISAMLGENVDQSILIGALHGDLVTLQEKKTLQPVTGAYRGLAGRTFPDYLVNMGKLSGSESYYIPWMQASFVMVANKKALPYLPKGADLGRLTYDQLLEWGRNINAKTGKKMIGFPAGEKGLMHRFFQGYLYPSFTASTLLKFRGSDAVAMWGYFKELWGYVHPGSLVYSTMSEPLLIEDVWIGWDHTARLIKVFDEKGGDFVAFPAPIGPKGRGFMTVLSGLAIPAGIANTKNLETLIDYLTQPAIQIRMLRETGFFPVVSTDSGDGIPESLRELSRAVRDQADSPISIPTLLPIGLGERGGDYNNLFMMTFSEIVLGGKDPGTILNANAGELQRIVDEANARCWLPDVSGERPCEIE